MDPAHVSVLNDGHKPLIQKKKSNLFVALPQIVLSLSRSKWTRDCRQCICVGAIWHQLCHPGAQMKPVPSTDVGEL